MKKYRDGVCRGRAAPPRGADAWSRGATQTSPVSSWEQGECCSVLVANPILTLPGAALATRAKTDPGCVCVALCKQ